MTGLLGRLTPILLLFSAPGFALIFQRDDRTFAQTNDERFQPIGLVKSSFGYGTGFLVDDCNVLTARHMRSETGEVLKTRLTFVPSGPLPSHPIEGRVIAAGNRAVEINGNTSRDRTGDWLILRLDKCIGSKVGFVSLDGQPPKVGLPLMNAGFPVDRPRRAGLSIDPSCQIHFVTDIGALHDCAFLPGNSGGPIFDLGMEGGRQTLRAVAIGSAGYPDHKVSAFGPGSANVATLIAPILPAIRPYLHPLYKGTDLADRFQGSGLFDVLSGGSGNDTFILDQWGGDVVTGGPGSDRVVLLSSSGNNHVFLDFKPSEGDSVDFSSIDADDTLAGIQHFKLVAGSPNQRGNARATLQCTKTGNETLVSLYVRHRGQDLQRPDYEILIGGCNISSKGLMGLG